MSYLIDTIGSMGESKPSYKGFEMQAADYQGRVLVVEGDAGLRAELRGALEKGHFRVDDVAGGDGVRSMIPRYSYDAVLLDLTLGEESGLEIIPFITKESPYTKVVVMTAMGAIDLAVDSFEPGSTTFITKSENPENITGELTKRLRALPVADDNVEAVCKQLGMIGRGQTFQDIISQIDQIKDVDAPVLLTGASGTGKEMIARAIHMLSGRRKGPFEAVNCGAIPDNLLESELFGYKRGAFTDAKEDRKGMFEICGGGTLFLDEIGELPLNLQVKLLRVLQERELKRIGDPQTIKINTRVICATNRDLEADVEAGRFREDFYFRLTVFPISLPSLCERREDIPDLVNHFLHQFNERYGRHAQPPGKDLMQRLQSADWPGNIRELQNGIERAVVLSRDGQLHAEDIFRTSRRKTVGGAEIDTVNYLEAKEKFERSFLKKILTVARGNISEAARISGRFRSDIYRLMEKYGMTQDEFR